MNERCFALKKDCSCSALDVKNCPGYLRCRFYRPKWRQDQLQRKMFKRLNSLPEAEQAYISLKYYKGMMPWREVCE